MQRRFADPQHQRKRRDEAHGEEQDIETEGPPVEERVAEHTQRHRNPEEQP